MHFKYVTILLVIAEKQTDNIEPIEDTEDDCEYNSGAAILKTNCIIFMTAIICAVFVYF